jgi:hypothetical protein
MVLDVVEAQRTSEIASGQVPLFNAERSTCYFSSNQRRMSDVWAGRRVHLLAPKVPHLKA